VKIWLDAQLSPAIAKWIEEAYEVEEAFSVQRLAILLRGPPPHQRSVSTRFFRDSSNCLLDSAGPAPTTRQHAGGTLRP